MTQGQERWAWHQSAIVCAGDGPGGWGRAVGFQFSRLPRPRMRTPHRRRYTLLNRGEAGLGPERSWCSVRRHSGPVECHHRRRWCGCSPRHADQKVMARSWSAKGLSVQASPRSCLGRMAYRCTRADMISTASAKFTGAHVIDEIGYVIGALFTTNTNSVGTVRDAAISWAFRSVRARAGVHLQRARGGRVPRRDAK